MNELATLATNDKRTCGGSLAPMKGIRKGAEKFVALSKMTKKMPDSAG